MVSLTAAISIVLMGCNSISSASASGQMNGILYASGKLIKKATDYTSSCARPSQRPKCSQWSYDSSRCQSRAVVSTCPDAWVASEQGTAIAAAEEAMALARAALLAAKEAGSLNESDVNRSFSLPDIYLQTDSSCLRSEIERLEAMIAMDTSRAVLGQATSPSIELVPVEKLATEDGTEDLDQALGYGSKKVDVVVSSKRRKQRILSRAKALEKRKKQEAALVARGTGVPAVKGGKQNKDGYCPQIIRRGRMTAAEELQSIKGIQELFKMEATKQNLKQQLGREPTFREWADGLNLETAELQTQLFSVRRSKEMMISSNLGLVIKVARKFAMKGTGVEDLIQEGIDGLLRGVQKFDTTRGFRLSTYVLWWIELAVRRAAVKRSILCDVPMHLFDMHTRVTKTRAKIYEERGEFATDEEVARLIGTSPARVNLAANLMRPPKSLEAKVPGYDNLTYLELVADTESETAFMEAERQLLKTQIERVLTCLKPREREILRLRHGIQDGRVRTLEELGHTFNLSRERVRQIEKKALRKIHDSGGKDVLASFATTFAGMSNL